MALQQPQYNLSILRQIYGTQLTLASEFMITIRNMMSLKNTSPMPCPKS